MLGGGQLGRYALVAARLMGYGTVVLDPDPHAPAGRVADEHLVAPYDDPAALDLLAARCAVVTTEFENPPAEALRRLARRRRRRPATGRRGHRPGPPGREAVPRRARHPGGPVRRRRRHDTARRRRLPRHPQDRPPRLRRQGSAVGRRRTRRLDAAWRDLGAVPCVLEQRLALDVELSVIVARRADGTTVAYPVAENHHVDGILDLTVVPARVDAAAGGGRRAPRPRRSPSTSTTSACWPSSCSSRMARCSSTSWRRARTTADTGRSTPPPPASSSSRCAPCAAWRSARRR